MSLVGSWLFCLQNLPCLVSLWCMCGARWRFEDRTFHIGSWRAKLILAPLGMSKLVWPSMNRYRMFFVQTSTLPPRMHHKFTKHGRFCKRNNQLPTKTHIELKDNSNVQTTYWTFSYHVIFYQAQSFIFYNVQTTYRTFISKNWTPAE
jgi:hypothetical protein